MCIILRKDFLKQFKKYVHKIPTWDICFMLYVIRICSMHLCSLLWGRRYPWEFFSCWVKKNFFFVNVQFTLLNNAVKRILFGVEWNHYELHCILCYVMYNKVKVMLMVHAAAFFKSCFLGTVWNKLRDFFFFFLKCILFVVWSG